MTDSWTMPWPLLFETQFDQNPILYNRQMQDRSDHRMARHGTGRRAFDTTKGDWSVSLPHACHREVELGLLDSLNPKPSRVSRRVASRNVLLVALLVLASCASGDGGTSALDPTTSVENNRPSETTTVENETTTTSTPPNPNTDDGTEPSERDCPPHIPNDLRLSQPSPTAASIEISQATYDCAHEVGLAYANDSGAIATLQSRGVQGPLLLVGRWIDAPLIADMERLAPDRIVAAGFSDRVLRYTLADFATESVTVDQQAELLPQDVSYDRVWLVDNFIEAVPLAVLGNQIGVRVITVPGDLRAASPKEREMIAAASEVELLSDYGEDAAWQLDVIRRGAELPGGGLLLFDPGHPRRMVAMYGHPQTSGLGVLGEQGPNESVERLRSIAKGYGADGSTVLPTFEIIATVAAASSGRDGNFSNETALDILRPLIETAAANDIYVVLDLQPGLSDYLSQAKIYEEFLRLGHVGLALDPEWRLKPGERHLQQIGTVDAAEINQVVEWLAGIVREEALPQKLLVLHQFKFSMITNRHLVETPVELAVLIHMDGQGPLGTKYSSWNALTRQPDADQFYWGWKNFYDEDSPTATAAQVLALTPDALFVSYQ